MPEEARPLFAPATRSSAIPLIVFYSESGCGKTYSALLLGRGIAGKKKLRGIDTERGRMSIYADDPLIGGYETALLEEPYTPKRHIEFIDAAEEGAGCVILDSGSHEWEGTGGVLNMAGENEEQSKRAGLHNWKKPKEQHVEFLAKLMRTKVPIIVCLRAKYKTRQMKGTKEMADQGLIQFKDVGKNCVVKDPYISPIQAEDFIFEATVHIQINHDHTIIVTKGGTPELRACFPADNKEPITVEHGRKVAQWIAGGGTKLIGSQSAPTTPPAAATTATSQTTAPADAGEPGDPKAAPSVTPNDDPEAKALRGQIWKIAMKSFADGAALSQYLWDEGIMQDHEALTSLSVSRLNQILAAVTERFAK